MSSILLRLGLWVILIVFGLYVLGETNENNPLSDLIDQKTLVEIGGLGLLIIGGGFVLGLFEKAASKLTRSVCQVCRKAIPKGEIYCRQHLRNILDEEFDKTRRERIPRR